MFFTEVAQLPTPSLTKILVAIERSCAAKEETPEQFEEEMRYLEHFPSEEDPRIQTEIEEVFCTKGLFPSII